MRFVRLFLFIAFMTISVPSFSADRQQAIDAYNRGDYQKVVQILRPLAEGGDSQSQNDLGWMYFSGLGVSPNDTKAATWYRLSAEQGFAGGQSSLGYMYESGRGVGQSLTEAVKWYRLSAEQGLADGQSKLGYMYESGRGVEQSLTEAVKWYRLSAEQGLAEGQTRLGVMYESGRGVEQSFTEAVKWYRLAAEQGYKHGQKNLGVMYQTGSGVPQSDTEAVKWFRLSAEQGNALAQANLGWHYQNGRGVTQSYPESIKWFRLSAEQGNEWAQDQLSQMEVDRTESQVAQQDSKSKSFISDDSERVKALEERLALLESQTKQFNQVIASDTQRPSILITDSSSDGARGTISGVATDNTGIAEVLIDGQAIAFDSSGRFNASTFIPADGIDVQITAYDLKGLSTIETIRLERTQRTQQVSRLAAVNPLIGPKQKPSRDRVALIIGLEQYAEAPPADYASRDAQMFADYAREKLGIAPGNIKVLTDTEATRSGLLRALKVWLPQAVQPDETDLYVFYAGHGMASDDGESAYIVPYGADTFLLEDTAISRERFYEEIGAAKPRTATFFFDNCYAGTTRSEERLLAQRPLTIKVQESPVPENYLVFTAGESNQTAGVLDEVKHGRFSYFVFKGLEGEADANQDGKISAGELHKYVRESVGRFSAGTQTPTMLGDAGRWVLQ